VTHCSFLVFWDKSETRWSALEEPYLLQSVNGSAGSIAPTRKSNNMTISQVSDEQEAKGGGLVISRSETPIE
jgi:hypothetical protein